MTSNKSIEYRITLCGLALLVALAPGCRSTPTEADSASDAPPATRESARAIRKASPDSNRGVFEGCVRAEEAARYEGLVGKKVLIHFAWTDMKSGAANLRAPAQIVRIEAPNVIVSFDPRVPNLDLYTSTWSYSGHIRGGSDGTFAVDPCSATIEEGSW